MNIQKIFNNATKALEDITLTVKNQVNVWKSAVDSQVQRLEDWKSNAIKRTTIRTSKDEYLPIAKYNSNCLVSSFRMIIHGACDSFVFGGIFDVIGSHHDFLEVKESATTSHGTINLKFSYGQDGDGYIELQRKTGIAGISNLTLTLIPYVGSVSSFDGDIPILTNTKEYTFV